MVGLKLAPSKSEARRLIEQGGVRLNGEKIGFDQLKLKSEDILQVGKRRFVKLRVR
jgi:tyrosyl-tRNA synthetase